MFYHAGYVCSGSISREGWAWKSNRLGNNKFLLWTESSNGELWSAHGKIHGSMFALQRRRGTQGCERGDRDDKTPEACAIRRMVPDGIQGI